MGPDGPSPRWEESCVGSGSGRLSPCCCSEVGWRPAATTVAATEAGATTPARPTAAAVTRAAASPATPMSRPTATTSSAWPRPPIELLEDPTNTDLAQEVTSLGSELAQSGTELAGSVGPEDTERLTEVHESPERDRYSLSDVEERLVMHGDRADQPGPRFAFTQAVGRADGEAGAVDGRPGRSVTTTEPLMDLHAVRRTMARPSPAPPASRARPSSRRTNRSNTRSRSGAGTHPGHRHRRCG